MPSQNHVIDPTYFYDAIEEFAFNYTLYVKSTKTVDDYGREHYTYSEQTIHGSLQSQGQSLVRSKSGNRNTKDYNFYCSSLYKINEGDFLQYENNFYICTGLFDDYDEWGVRGAYLKLVSLTSYRDLAEYVAYKTGEKIV